MIKDIQGFAKKHKLTIQEERTRKNPATGEEELDLVRFENNGDGFEIASHGDWASVNGFGALEGLGTTIMDEEEFGEIAQRLRAAQKDRIAAK